MLSFIFSFTSWASFSISSALRITLSESVSLVVLSTSAFKSVASLSSFALSSAICLFRSVLAASKFCCLVHFHLLVSVGQRSRGGNERLPVLGSLSLERLTNAGQGRYCYQARQNPSPMTVHGLPGLRGGDFVAQGMSILRDLHRRPPL
jgi:hypothetical protein